MIQAYSQNVTLTAMQPIPFNNVTLKKGCTVTQSGPASFALNKCGVYEVCCGVSAEAANTIQLYKDGIAVQEAKATGNSPSFTTLVQVDHDNSCCACASPTIIQVVSEAAVTLSDASIVITKLC